MYYFIIFFFFCDYFLEFFFLAFRKKYSQYIVIKTYIFSRIFTHDTISIYQHEVCSAFLFHMGIVQNDDHTEKNFMTIALGLESDHMCTYA